MSSRLGRRVKKLAKLRSVTRRDAATWVDGRDTPGAKVTAKDKLAVQRETAKPIELARLPAGDQTSGDIRVWAEPSQLAAAFVSDPDIPLGWTELQTAQPERAEGPPGDLVDFEGRRYEITERIGWTESATFTGPSAGFQRYVAQERGATP